MSDSLNNFFKAAQMFKEGVSQYQTTQAVNDATEQVHAINQQQIDEKARSIALEKSAQELALRMTAAGSEPGRIQSAVEGLMPSAGAKMQVGAQKEMQTQSLKSKASEGQLNRESAERIASIKAASTGAAAKLPEKEVKFLKNNQDAFDKIAKKSLESLNQIRLAEESVNKGNPIGDKAIVNFMARASGEVGALTEADKAPFGGSQALDQRFAQFAENQKSGKLTESNRTFVKELINTYKNVHQSNVMNARDQISSRAEDVAKAGGYKLSKDDIANALYKVNPKADPNAAAITAAQAWLSDPANANNPKADQVKQKIIQMQGQP